MISILLAAHGELGPTLLRVAEGIVGPMEAVRAVALERNEAPEKVRRAIETLLAEMDTRDGVLILTDMFGGTPTNQSLPFIDAGRVEVLTGVNLPMVLKAHSSRREMNLAELASFLRDYGARNIVLASEIWGRRAESCGGGRENV